MPELPEVESVRRQLAPAFRGRRIQAVHACPQRRFAGLERLPSRTVLDVSRRGKFLVCPLDSGLELVLHLGMTGSLRFDEVDAYTRARFNLDNGRELVFRDVRRFGRISVVATGDYRSIPTLAALGPEPLCDDFDPNRFATALAATRAPVKAALLAQRYVAGVGNIYADEALWRARIHPGSRRVGRSRAIRLHAAIRAVLKEAIAHEGTTFRDYRMVNGESGRHIASLQVYGRAGGSCSRCGTVLRKVIVAQRGTTYCPACQRG